jgi:hypothetical protein
MMLHALRGGGQVSTEQHPAAAAGRQQLRGTGGVDGGKWKAWSGRCLQQAWMDAGCLGFKPG